MRVKADKPGKGHGCLLFIYCGIVFNAFNEFPVGFVCCVVIKNIYNEAFFYSVLKHELVFINK